MALFLGQTRMMWHTFFSTFNPSKKIKNVLVMKKIYAIILLLCWNLSAQGQEFNIGEAGIKAGVNTFGLRGNDIGSTNTLIGYHFGGYAQFSITNIIHFQPELLLAINRWEAEENSLTHAVWTYLDVPLLIAVDIPNAEGLSIHVGPQVGFLLSAKVKGETSGGAEVDIDRTDSVKGLNMGLALGAGYALKSGIRFSVRYILGLPTVAEEDPDFPDPDVKTQSFQLSISYSLLNK